MDLLIDLIAICAAILLFIASIAFLRARGIFTMIYPVIISNFYIIPLILLMIGVDKFSALSFVKLLVIIILNLVMTQLLCYMIGRKSLGSETDPDID